MRLQLALELQQVLQEVQLLLQQRATDHLIWLQRWRKPSTPDKGAWEVTTRTRIRMMRIGNRPTFTNEALIEIAPPAKIKVHTFSLGSK